MKKGFNISIIIISIITLYSCSKKEGCTNPNAINYNIDAEKDDGSCIYNTSGPRQTTLDIPKLFSNNIIAPIIPADNPQTIEGITLGRKLFFDPILSGDGTQACASCHSPKLSFTDTNQFSKGINLQEGTRNSMPLFNLAWNWKEKFFWDGKANSLEEQALMPIIDPLEMNNTWINAITNLQADPDYPKMFDDAFGTSIIDSILVTKAIAQFERTLISANSKFDDYLMNQATLSIQESRGFDIFMSEEKGDCFHCHGEPKNPLWTDNEFHNNGLDATFTDNGLGSITGNPADNGKFKTPSLRNLAYTAPYMHDGRFKTLDEVIDHYSSGLKSSTTIDPLMKSTAQGGVRLSPSEKSDLKSFLLSLSDSEFITNPNFEAPQ